MLSAQVHRPRWTTLAGTSGLLLMWLWFGPEFLLWWSLGFFVFFIGPLWLAHVFGKPSSQRRRH